MAVRKANEDNNIKAWEKQSVSEMILNNTQKRCSAQAVGDRLSTTGTSLSMGGHVTSMT